MSRLVIHGGPRVAQNLRRARNARSSGRGAEAKSRGSVLARSLL
jgi:hypothetical protein